MKVTEHLANATRPLISFEIIPPLRGGNARGLLALIDELVRHRPPFIDITSHSAEVVYDESPEGIQRRVKRKHPGTLGVCALIQNKYDIDAVPHILCHGFTREETEDFLIELKYLGIDNVLAVRGDDSGYRKPLHSGRSTNDYAVDLVRQIAAMNAGRYPRRTSSTLSLRPSASGSAAIRRSISRPPSLAADVPVAKEKIAAAPTTSSPSCSSTTSTTPTFSTVPRGRPPGSRSSPASRSSLAGPTRLDPTHLPRRHPPAPRRRGRRAANPERVRDVGVDGPGPGPRAAQHGAPSVHFYVMLEAGAVSPVVGRLDL